MRRHTRRSITTIGLSALFLLLLAAQCDFPAAQLSIADAAVSEGDSEGGSTMVFAVTLDGSAVGGVQVSYSTVDGSATAGSNDYIATSGTLTFSGDSGERQTITVEIVGDDAVETDETFEVVLSNIVLAGTPVEFSDDRAEGTIRNDDILQTE